LVYLLQNGFTALHYASINGHARLVVNLVSRGYRVDSRDSVCAASCLKLFCAANH